MNPLDYSLCDQTVTVYRKADGEIGRTVIENAYLSAKVSMPNESYGKSKEKTFLLIIPGGDFPLQTGDRIFDGTGPETVDWQAFVPAAVPALYEAAYVKPCRWEGEITHWEAGNRKETL